MSNKDAWQIPHIYNSGEVTMAKNDEAVKQDPVWWYLHILFRNDEPFKIGNSVSEMTLMATDLQMEDKTGANYKLVSIRSDNLHMDPPVGTLTANKQGSFKAVWNESASETAFVKV